MGTRAQFFIGNPQDLESRKWLGCVAWDGHIEGDCGEALRHVKTADGFQVSVDDIKAKRDDFCDPATHAFPFPWRDDLFLTDVTFAFFDGRVQATYFHRGWIDLSIYLDNKTEREAYHDRPEALPGNVPAPVRADLPPGPDSIMIFRAG